MESGLYNKEIKFLVDNLKGDLQKEMTAELEKT